MSGFLGGYLNQGDNAQLTITFTSATNTALGTATIGTVSQVDRGNVIGLFSCNTSGAVPIGTRTVEAVLSVTRTDGSSNNGCADNLSFVLTSPTAAFVTVGGRVTTAVGRGISRANVSVTGGNGNVQTTSTNPFGYFQFVKLPAGDTYIFSVRAKRYQFGQPTQVLNINEDFTDLNFTAFPQQRGF